MQNDMVIKDKVREMEWALECASRIFKEKHEAATRYLKKVMAAERTISDLSNKLVEKDDSLRNALSLLFEITPIDVRTRPSAIADKVSVIIPVNNGGEKLKGLLGMIRSQRKVNDIEIIVIDSGSSDNSKEIAAGFGAVIIDIPQKEFNHGMTRNTGAAKATGDYLVFTVQDALPINNYWLYNMVCPLIEYPRLAALSSKQFVKPEADLFSLWKNELLGTILGFEQDSMYTLLMDIGGIGLRAFDGATKRRLTFFDNVSSCVRRDIFGEVKFTPMMNAEDIDFGVKLLHKRKVIGYLNSTGVYHWHERGAVDVLKRHSIGSKANVHTLQNELPYLFSRYNITWDQLVAVIIGTYNLINLSISESNPVNSNPMTALKSLLSAIQKNINKHPDGIEKGLKRMRIQGDEGLNILYSMLFENAVRSPQNMYNFKQNILIPNIMNYLNQFSEYLLARHNTLSGREEDFVACIYKIYAMTVGDAIGAYYLEAESLNRVTSELNKIDEILAKGVCYQ
ncbi:MAG: glycosyltransferase family 2 protein [Nitrospirae bacterium]|nr:glycosyltransferase family 2 protein [Nitrospirota bacterium]